MDLLDNKADRAVLVKKAEIAAENNEESASKPRTFPKTFELLAEIEVEAARRADLTKITRDGIRAIQIGSEVI